MPGAIEFSNNIVLFIGIDHKLALGRSCICLRSTLNQGYEYWLNIDIIIALRSLYGNFSVSDSHV
jgi:hypothetical protein